MATKRVRIYTAEDVAEHTAPGNCWVSRKGKVYDVSKFLSDHPGGDDYILTHAGKDIDGAMKDAVDHVHSDSAYDMLDEFCIGKLGSEEAIVDENWEARDDFHPEETDTAADFEKNQFLDLKKPLLKQVWFSNFSKSYYLQQIHQPRHVVESARLFGPSYLEVFTKTMWYVVPIFWGPITTYLFLRSVIQFTAGPLPPFSSQPLLPLSVLFDAPMESFMKTLACFFLGNLIWTLLEYTLHQFLTLHFLLHGVHHYLPMDRLRLVMPPPLFGALQAPFTRLAHITFCMIACTTALHHTMLPAYLREMKKYHLAHHYKNFELAFGVTSKVWDIVFGTYLQL
ncbi:oxidoreductase [Flagelloscypha sp. PMI_526]|nr:oxidoreductase [Flagelloscypha sp. PMI_526]